MLTVRIFGEDLVGNLRGITNTNRVDGTDPDDVFFLWFDSIINLKVELLDGSAVDPEPLQLRTGLSHFHMVTSDWAAAIFGRRLPGDIDVLPAGVWDFHLQWRGWSAWRKRKMSEFTSDSIL